MDGFSMLKFFFYRQLKRTKMTSFVLLAICLISANSASLQKSPGKSQNSAYNESSSYSRQFPVQFDFVTPALVANQHHSWSFPFYQPPVANLHPTLQLQQLKPAAGVKSNIPSSHQAYGKTEPREQQSDSAFQEEIQTTSDTNHERPPAKESKNKTPKRTQPKEDNIDNSIESVKGKVDEDDGTGRACPACVGGECDPNLDPHTNISGIPIIQIILAGLIGAFWAAIFLFILHNFVLRDKKHAHAGVGGGYGGYEPTGYGSSAEYGAPHEEYGAPHQDYGRIANRNGRSSSQGYSFNDLANWVSKAIEKLTETYDDQNLT